MSDSCDCSPPAFSGHGIFQARILEWVAVSFSRWGGLPDPGIEPRSPALQSLYRLSHSGGPGGPWISRQNPVQAGDQRPTFDRVSGIPAAPAPGCRAPQDVHATCRGWLGQETKLVLHAFRCVATHSKARRASLETQWVKSLPEARRAAFEPWFPRFLPGEFRGQWSLVGCSPWGHKSRTRLSASHFHPFSLPTLALPCLTRSAGLDPPSPRRR